MQPADGGPQFPRVMERAVALEATITDGDWTLLQSLWQAGVSDGGMHRLLRLPARCRTELSALDRPAAPSGAPGPEAPAPPVAGS
jgi:hypothetical protein